MRAILRVRQDWTADLACLRQCHAWLLQAEAWLSPLRDPPATEEAFARWLQTFDHLPQAVNLPPVYAKCLEHFVGVLHRLQPYLLSWIKVTALPRTNNDVERFIRAIKTRYRRISGRKNWNAYLLRYGRRTAFYEDAALHPEPTHLVEQRIRSLASGCWSHARSQQRLLDQRLRTQFHFLHKRTHTLRLLEQRWAHTVDCT